MPTPKPLSSGDFHRSGLTLVAAVALIGLLPVAVLGLRWNKQARDIRSPQAAQRLTGEGSPADAAARRPVAAPAKALLPVEEHRLRDKTVVDLSQRWVVGRTDAFAYTLGRLEVQSQPEGTVLSAFGFKLLEPCGVKQREVTFTVYRDWDGDGLVSAGDTLAFTVERPGLRLRTVPKDIASRKLAQEGRSYFVVQCRLGASETESPTINPKIDWIEFETGGKVRREEPYRWMRDLPTMQVARGLAGSRLAAAVAKAAKAHTEARERSEAARKAAKLLGKPEPTPPVRGYVCNNALVAARPNARNLAVQRAVFDATDTRALLATVKTRLTGTLGPKALRTVKLYLDRNADGAVDPKDKALGRMRPRGGEVVFDRLMEEVPKGEAIRLLLAVDTNNFTARSAKIGFAKPTFQYAVLPESPSAASKPGKGEGGMINLDLGSGNREKAAKILARLNGTSPSEGAKLLRETEKEQGLKVIDSAQIPAGAEVDYYYVDGAGTSRKKQVVQYKGHGQLASPDSPEMQEFFRNLQRGTPEAQESFKQSFAQAVQQGFFAQQTPASLAGPSRARGGPSRATTTTTVRFLVVGVSYPAYTDRSPGPATAGSRYSDVPAYTGSVGGAREGQTTYRYLGANNPAWTEAHPERSGAQNGINRTDTEFRSAMYSLFFDDTPGANSLRNYLYTMTHGHVQVAGTSTDIQGWLYSRHILDPLNSGGIWRENQVGQDICGTIQPVTPDEDYMPPIVGGDGRWDFGTVIWNGIIDPSGSPPPVQVTTRRNYHHLLSYCYYTH
ncbi:MAG: hypothetical protein GW911_27070, partial [Armatimonadetes bacterium]|nr:hypothetical protein [Armatimonadota bacterium]